MKHLLETIYLNLIHTQNVSQERDENVFCILSQSLPTEMNTPYFLHHFESSRRFGCWV